MKKKTDPETGIKSCTLATPDRNKLANAAEVLEEWGWHLRGQAGSDGLAGLVDEIGVLLAGSSPWDHGDNKVKPEPPAE